MGTAHYRVEAGVAVITLDNPPVNGMGHAVREAAMMGLQQAQTDEAVRAIMLTGANGVFSGGADIREFNTPKALAKPTLMDLIAAAESSPKPVIAAINGTCMGGGLELSLGCHYRVAAAKATLALPEVKLGLIPGAGGTQRLTRAVGVERALEMIVSGNPVAAARLAGTPLLDEVIEGDFDAAAMAFARRVAEEGLPLKRIRDRNVEIADAARFFDDARRKAVEANPRLPAPARCVDAVRAAVEKPFEEGAKYEREVFLELIRTDESRALRHAFFGERAAAKISDVPADTPLREVKSVAVIGAGTMGGGIAMAFLNAGFPVTILETTQEALDRGLATLRRNYEGSVKRGKLTIAESEARMARLTPTLSYDALRDVDLVIEAVFEDLAVKEAVFRRLDAAAKPRAILATNTSTLDVDRIAAVTSRPQDVIGLHFFSPAHVMRLLEVVRGEKTAKDVLATAMQLGRRIGKLAVVSGVCDGFIGNRMLEQYLRQAMFLLEEGASPGQVDRALEDFGMAMGPFRMSDLAGNDIGWAIRKRRYVEKPDVAYSRIADRLCELGRFGQKTGAGWYRYERGGRGAQHDPAVDEMIWAYRKANALTPRTIDAAEIVDRCVYALVNEGARILEEGIAARASDIDMVYLTGYGFPRHRGGPMMHADMIGLSAVVARMAEFERRGSGDPGSWRPAPRLARLSRDGRGFNG
ncbi:MAG TPA: 3-hydroxyacyl-CoA dehydrogenase NAD-binding domain-containing protein [Usitatibacter sp.]|nr:3-hydroxyacyl-CoA dehydrogenase NAD-binding domain-containing protein [Usitatibacter sp.]